MRDWINWQLWQKYFYGMKIVSTGIIPAGKIMSLSTRARKAQLFDVPVIKFLKALIQISEQNYPPCVRVLIIQPRFLSGSQNVEIAQSV